MSRTSATLWRWAGLAKSWPPSRFVVLLNSREPIALHWPVIEFAPVPGRPMLPVISARLMIACAVRTALMALVDAHRPPERDALARRESSGRTARSLRRAGRVSAATRSSVIVLRRTPRSRRSRCVWAAMKSRSIQSRSISSLRDAVEQRQVRLGIQRPGAASRPSPFRSPADR